MRYEVGGRKERKGGKRKEKGRKWEEKREEGEERNICVRGRDDRIVKIFFTEEVTYASKRIKNFN